MSDTEVQMLPPELLDTLRDLDRQKKQLEREFNALFLGYLLGTQLAPLPAWRIDLGAGVATRTAEKGST